MEQWQFEDWQRSKRYRSLYFVMVAAFPFVGAFFIFNDKSNPTDDLFPKSFIPLGVYFIALFLVGLNWRNFRCPRCDKKFFYRYFYFPFNRKCLHCSFSMDERDDSENGATSQDGELPDERIQASPDREN